MKAALLLAALFVTSSICARAQQVTWQAVTSSAPEAPGGCTCNGYERLFLPSASSVWLINQMPVAMYTSAVKLHYSPDDGQTWQMAVVGSTTRSSSIPPSTTVGTMFVDLFVASDQAVWLVLREIPGNTRTLKISRTGINGFQATTTPFPASLSTVAFVDAATGVAVGTSNGQLAVQRTTNGGATWAPVTVPPAAATEQVSKRVVVGNTIWFITTLGDVLRSADAGATWTRTATGLTSGRMGLAFRDAQHGLAYAALPTSTPTGELAATTDGGLTWTRVTPTGDFRFLVMEAVPGTNIYLAGGSELYVTGRLPVTGLARSVDEGRSWQLIDANSPYSLLAVGSVNRAWMVSPYDPSPGGAPFPRYQVYRSSTPLASRPAALSAEAGLYPNPTSGAVQLPAQHRFCEARVYDAAGRLQRRLPVAAGSTQLDLHGLPEGLYQVALRTDAGTTLTQRLAVQR